MVIQADKSNCAVLAALAAQLWEGHTPSELEHGFEELAENSDAACFIKYVDNQPVGFAQCQLKRDYVEGTHSSPVGYLEGIFVLEDYRKKGYARELLGACEKWALNKKCTEFASDCEMENEVSLQFHLAMGFEVANRIICFKKSIRK